MLLAVYGTLRRGGALNPYLGNAPFLGQETVPGYEMYSFGSYPYITPGDGDILAEVFDVAEREATKTERMERSAGYKMAEIQTRFGTAHLFYVPEETHQRQVLEWETPRIKSGNWMDYLNEKRGILA